LHQNVSRIHNLQYGASLSSEQDEHDKSYQNIPVLSQLLALDIKPEHYTSMVFRESTQYLSNILNITDCKKKDSASKSIIITGELKLQDNQKVFCKFFKISDENKNLLYEKNIYRYINQYKLENPELKDIIDQHIICAYDIIYLYTDQLTKLFNEKDQAIQNRYNERIVSLDIDNELLCGIITPSYPKSLKLKNKLIELFTNNFTNNKHKIIQIIFNALYSIYLLHIKLGIMHNDNHFENILYYDTPLYKKTYKFNTINIESNQDFTTRIFDFDHSNKVIEHSSKKYNNPYLTYEWCEKFGSCNKHSQKDVFIFIAELFTIKRNYINESTNIFIDEIINILLKNNHKLYNAFYRNIVLNKDAVNKPTTIFWSAYVAINPTNGFFDPNSGHQASYPDLEITEVLERYIKEYKDNFLSITIKTDQNVNVEQHFPDVQSITHKKYLKYKHKYITLKNKMML
jgi:hypothetical protein